MGGRDFDFSADIFFGFRNAFDSAKFDDTVPVLSAETMDLSFTLRDVGTGQNHPLSGAEYRIIFEQLLDSDLAFQTLCFCDPSDGYVGGFRLIDEALLQNLEREPLFQLHSRGTQNGPDRPGRSALFPDDFTEVALSNSQFKNRRLLSFDRAYRNLVGIIH